MSDLTIAFVDLTGSTSVFETLGNDRATKAVTKLTQWIGSRGQAHGGTVVKMLGDGVLMAFGDNRACVEAMTQIQQEHAKRVQQWPPHLKLLMQVGLARGPVVWVDGDCFGDAVNLASRLSDLAGPEQIFATDTVVQQLEARSGVRSRSLGPMRIKGKVDPCEVFRIEWQLDMQSEFLTMPAALHAVSPREDSDFVGIELAWLDATRTFGTDHMPVRIGRVPEAGFVVNDPRVSRMHAQIELRAGNYVLEDLSSYGTWVRFAGSDALVALRRQEVLLTGDGEIALGAPFSDFSAPTVSFKLVNGRMVLGRNPATA
jgi:class 3 adenylate cyclase